MIIEKFLMYRWAQHCDETYILFSDKVKIRSRFWSSIEINFRSYFVPFITRDTLNCWANSCKNIKNLAIRTKQRDKKILFYAIYSRLNQRKLD